MKGKLTLLSVLILPWLSLFMINKLTFKKYLPVLTFSSLVIAFLSELSKYYRWWKIKNPLFPKLSSSIPFIFGPFLVANLWVFKLTYGNFKKYLLVNVLFDYLFAYPLTTLAEKLKVYKMLNMTRFQLFILSIATAIVNYGYQLLIQEVIKPADEMKK